MGRDDRHKTVRGLLVKELNSNAGIFDTVAVQGATRIVGVPVEGDREHPDVPAADHVRADGGVPLIETDPDVAATGDLIPADGGRADSIVVHADVVH